MLYGIGKFSVSSLSITANKVIDKHIIVVVLDK